MKTLEILAPLIGWYWGDIVRGLTLTAIALSVVTTVILCVVVFKIIKHRREKKTVADCNIAITTNGKN